MNNNFGTLLVANAPVRIENIGFIVFKDTVGGQDAGVANIQSNSVSNGLFHLENCGKVEFLNNNSELRGGAIAVGHYYGARPSDVLLSADHGDIIFKGNHVRGFVNPANPYLNAIFFGAEGRNIGTATELSHFTLRAQEGRSIIFYDPITSKETTDTKTYKMKLSFNEAVGGRDTAYTGIIRFDGAEVEKTIIKDSVLTETESAYQARINKSRYSDFQGDTTLYGGTLILTNKVIFGRKIVNKPPAETSFTLIKGILEITKESQMNAFNVNFSGRDSVLRMDNSSKVIASQVDMSKGISFDLLFHLDNTDAGAVFETTNLLLGDRIGMEDTADSYTDNRFQHTLSITLLDKSKSKTVTGNFTGILSNLTGSNLVEDPYQYQGE